MALLTTDIVWLEMQQVSHPDGSSTQALVPSIAADSVTLAALGNIDFTGAEVNATNSLNITAAGVISANAVRDVYVIDIKATEYGKMQGVTVITAARLLRLVRLGDWASTVVRGN